MLLKKISLFFGALLISFLHLGAQSFDWSVAVPEDEGFSSAKLDAMCKTLARHHTSSLLVIRNDRIVLEWYAEGRNAGYREGTASMAKALVGGMSLSLAQQDGRLQVDDPAWKYIPEWKDDPLKSQITIRQLATHTSGIEDSEISEQDRAAAKAKGIKIKDKHMDIPGWKAVSGDGNRIRFRFPETRRRYCFPPAPLTSIPTREWPCCRTRSLPVTGVHLIRISGNFCGNVFTGRLA